jgi:hypothetical protein
MFFVRATLTIKLWADARRLPVASRLAVLTFVLVQTCSSFGLMTVEPLSFNPCYLRYQQGMLDVTDVSEQHPLVSRSLRSDMIRTPLRVLRPNMDGWRLIARLCDLLLSNIVRSVLLLYLRSEEESALGRSPVWPTVVSKEAGDALLVIRVVVPGSSKGKKEIDHNSS